jgi:hypothetical protein
MITLEGDSLVFRFPEVHEDAKTEIRFQRTLRIPDDGKHYPLPPGLGSFRLRHVDDFAARVPKDWRSRGGVMMPLYQAEAMWISFCGVRWSEGYPCAIKIAAGKINAVSGKPWKTELDGSDRDYVVVPEQPWLDGFCVAKDSVRQFVAMPLGAGYSVEEQITGKPEHGGLQVIVYPMKKERYEIIRRKREEARKREGVRLYCLASAPSPRAAAMPAAAMGLAAGGRMSQQVYDDPHGLDAWDQSVSSRCFVTLVDAVQWCEITGETPPTKPPTATEYSDAGLPWFDYYAADLATLAGAPELTAVKSVVEMAEEKGEDPLGPEAPVDPKLVVKLGSKAARKPRPVREAHT